jgi:ATP-dependent DNA helicase DinG
MHSAPVEVAPVLADALFGQIPTVILTSATLAVGGRLEYFRDRLGAGEACRLLCLGSPFDHARQMRLHVATNAPNPNDKEAYSAAVAQGVLRWALKTRGRAFALFTSGELLKRTAETLREPLEKAGLTLLAQGEGLTRRAMLETFRADAGFVLFGLDSFWMGVDVQGAALSNVILTRLPFAVPGLLPPRGGAENPPGIRAPDPLADRRRYRRCAGFADPDQVVRPRLLPVPARMPGGNLRTVRRRAA